MSGIGIVTYWSTLMHYAKRVGEARLEGDLVALAKAEDELLQYQSLVLLSDYHVIDA